MKADRHVHDRADAEAEDQLVIGKGGTNLGWRVGDENLAAVEYLPAPWRALLRFTAR